jgi:hypothetical protein
MQMMIFVSMVSLVFEIENGKYATPQRLCFPAPLLLLVKYIIIRCCMAQPDKGYRVTDKGYRVIMNAARIAIYTRSIRPLGGRVNG